MHENAFENAVCKMAVILSGGDELKAPQNPHIPLKPQEETRKVVSG